MPHLTLDNSAYGPVIDILVGPSAPRATALTKAGTAVPAPVAARALIDTGASCSAVDPSIMKSLSLLPTGRTQITTPSTGAIQHGCNQFDVSIFLLGNGMSLQISAVPVIECDLIAQNFGVLIGRDILANCILIYNGASNRFALAF